MLDLQEFIKENELFEAGDIVGVGVSGGSDSMALLHYLAVNQEKFDIEVVAIHVDHGIRENSYLDAEFVKEKAKEFGVRFYKFHVDCPKIAREKGISIETAGREARYDIFKSLLNRGVVSKIALAHHVSDQAETVLMHIFRGSGLSGAKGMSAVQDKVFVRPFLETTKDEILKYLSENSIDYRDDESNFDSSYNRNFVRNVIMKEICSRWPNAQEAIANFAKAVKEDDEYISKQIYDDAVITEEKVAKIPLSYFCYDKAIISRIIFKAVKSIGITKDVEKKHIDAIIDLAKNSDNGKRVYLPFEAVAVKEYDYLTIHNRHKEEIVFSEPFKSGDFNVGNIGKLSVKRVKDFSLEEGELLLDSKKVPKGAIWRFREDGDMFTKFGGGTKKLKSYLIDKKIPLRLRDTLPVLAYEHEIYAIVGVEISDKVKLDKNSLIATKIKFTRF